MSVLLFLLRKERKSNPPLSSEGEDWCGYMPIRTLEAGRHNKTSDESYAFISSQDHFFNMTIKSQPFI